MHDLAEIHLAAMEARGELPEQRERWNGRDDKTLVARIWWQDADELKRFDESAA